MSDLRMRNVILASLALANLAGCTIIPPAAPGAGSAPPVMAQPSPVPAPAPLTPAPPRQDASHSQPSRSDASLVHARLGQTVSVEGPRVTPIAVIEDSRCPMNARCVWAGQVRLRVKIDLGSGSSETLMTSGEPIQVADGTLELVEVQPDKVAGQSGGAVEASNYRFGFRFRGGI